MQRHSHFPVDAAIDKGNDSEVRERMAWISLDFMSYHKVSRFIDGKWLAMTHPVTLEIPDDVFQPLLRIAQANHQTIESVANACLAESAQAAPGSRLRRWIGASSSGVADASLRHDDYLGQAILDEMQGKGDA